MRYITSREHPLFKKLVKLQNSSRQRHQAGLALLDGVHLLQSYLASENIPELMILSEAGCKLPEIANLLNRINLVSKNSSLMLSDALFSQISSVKTPVGVLALIRIPQTYSPAEMNRCVFCIMLEAIQDPGNLGSILRSAVAAGVSDVFLSSDCADSWSSKTLRAGMGAHFSLRIHEHANLVQLARQYNGEIVATTLANATSVFLTDLVGPTVFVFGNEGSGLSREILEVTDKRVTIPMSSHTESLNVAAAAAICLFEKVRQHSLLV